MPHFPAYNFFGTPVPNFTVNNDRVLDNLRVRHPMPLCPPAKPYRSGRVLRWRPAYLSCGLAPNANRWMFLLLNTFI